MTPDGRHVAFVSGANNLVAGDTNGIVDVFVRDLQAGVTVLASPGAIPLSLSSSSESPDITPDGRYVAFYSTATNLVAGVVNAQDIYVRDLVGGTTIWASTGARAAGISTLNVSNLVCYNHALSDDGNFVVYEASPASSVNPIYPGLILRYSLSTGATDLLHTNAAIEAATGGLDIRNLDITPDGQRIVFVASTNGVTGSTTCILLWDATSNACSLVSGDLNGNVVTNAMCDWPSIDPTGQFVVFNSTATNLVTNALAGVAHLYLRDLQTGATTLLDADTNGVGSFIGPMAAPCLSADARFVAFECNDGNLFPNDRNRSSDIVVRDLGSGAIELISTRDPALASVTPNGLSTAAMSGLSGDGRYIAFASDADNLVTNDTNTYRDVFVRDQTKRNQPACERRHQWLRRGRHVMRPDDHSRWPICRLHQLRRQSCAGRYEPDVRRFRARSANWRDHVGQRKTDRDRARKHQFVFTSHQFRRPIPDVPQHGQQPGSRVV